MGTGSWLRGLGADKGGWAHNRRTLDFPLCWEAKEVCEQKTGEPHNFLLIDLA